MPTATAKLTETCLRNMTDAELFAEFTRVRQIVTDARKVVEMPRGRFGVTTADGKVLVAVEDGLRKPLNFVERREAMAGEDLDWFGRGRAANLLTQRILAEEARRADAKDAPRIEAEEARARALAERRQEELRQAAADLGADRLAECHAGGRHCQKRTASRPDKLAFFKHRPTLSTDTYYCGCWGWN